MAGSRAVLQHAAGTLGGILQKQNSTAAQGDMKGLSQATSSSAVCVGDNRQGHEDAFDVYRG